MGAVSPGLLAQPGRRARIGYLLLNPKLDPPSPERRAFLEGLAALGYQEGRNIEIVYKSAENEPAFMDDVARDLVAAKVDVICTSGSAATMSAKAATAQVPIVMLAVGDPVGIGAVKSVARPGANVTGVSFISSDLAPKRVQMLKEILPEAKRVGLLWDTRNANARSEAMATRAAIRSLGMAVEDAPVAGESGLLGAMRRLAARKVHALYVAFEGGLVAGNRTQIAELALADRVPVVAGWSGLADAGAIMSYAADIPDMFRRAAMYVHRVLQGEKPHGMPIEMPTRVELVLNLRSAKRLGLEIPKLVLLRADRVIE